HHIRTAFLDKSSRCSNGTVHTQLLGPGKIATHNGSPGAPPHCLASDHHFIERNLERARVPQKIDTYRISNGNKIHARSIRNLCDLKVPCDVAHDLLTFSFHLVKRRDGRLF